MSAHTSALVSRSAWRSGGPPASTRAPRAASPQVGGARSTTPAGAGPPARVAPRQRASPAGPLTTVKAKPKASTAWVSSRVTSWPWARHQAGRWTPRWGSRPVTPTASPGRRPARARSTRTWAPRSKPRSSRAIVGTSGDRPLAVVEAEAVDRRLESGVAGGPPGQPLLEPLEVEQRPDLGVGVVHGQQQVFEPGQGLGRAGVGHGHVAVV